MRTIQNQNALRMNKTVHKVNQVHSPLPKQKRVDGLGNDTRRLYFKEGNSSMLFCKCTENAGKALLNHLYDMAKKLGISIEGKFICTR